ncbi:MAG: hypothetical protein FJW86_02335 [Actinobacteria bacterium]|nr:hypothetical protein [Actinomycetota bacterium]
MTMLLDCAPLERAVEEALDGGDQQALHVLGYGEITSVLAWPNATGPWACKRMPGFDSVERFELFRTRFHTYADALKGKGVDVLESWIEAVPAVDGRLTAYVIQPVLEPDSLAPAVLARSSPEEARTVIDAVIDRVFAVSSPTVGIDAQLSNWACIDRELVYFDLTTPMLRDDRGRDLLDTELIVAFLPPVLRPAVRKFLVRSILDQFFEPRAIALDIAANLFKERLDECVPTVIELANARLTGVPPLSFEEARRYYRRDMRVWGMLQTARRMDRSWQRVLRRRHYRYLLPGRIERPV